jgi:hypothetical protein
LFLPNEFQPSFDFLRMELSPTFFAAEALPEPSRFELSVTLITTTLHRSLRVWYYASLHIYLQLSTKNPSDHEPLTAGHNVACGNDKAGD